MILHATSDSTIFSCKQKHLLSSSLLPFLPHCLSSKRFCRHLYHGGTSYGKKKRSVTGGQWCTWKRAYDTSGMRVNY